MKILDYLPFRRSTDASAPPQPAEPATAAHQFGTFKGVFLPSLLTIFGVIMYLRLGWVVGNVGLFGSIAVITLANSITFFTGLSISAIATNMKVGAGGAYYMISRSFGVETGAAVGLPLFFAQALGVSFYIVGFSESLHFLIPALPEPAISVVSLITLSALAYVSADLALKAQFFIFVVVVASLVSFFLGGPPPDGFSISTSAPSIAPFWTVFAVFFPAVTGIEAGVAMSGDLKNAAKSLPRGTIGAVLIGYAMYIAIAVFLYQKVPLDVLRADPEIFRKVAVVGVAILLGIWGATLSSALGSLLGAPRTLQALARDRILPRWVGRGHGPADEPRIATAITFLIALGGILLGNIDAIAPILSMFFLTSYGFLNLATALEGIMGNPSWRPAFKTPWVLSLTGAAACFSVMLMINAGATYVAGAACALVYYLTLRRNIGGGWNDMRRGILMLLARFSIYRLATYQQDTKSWRPNLLVFSGTPSSRWYLIELADAINQGKGFMTVATIVSESGIDHKRLKRIEASVREYLYQRNVPSLVEAAINDDPYSGMMALISRYGIGPLVPNTLILGETESPQSFIRFAELVRAAYLLERNVVVVRQGEPGTQKPVSRSDQRIDIWWGGQRKNAGLMLTLAYMLQNSSEWRGATLHLKSLVRTEEQREGALQHLTAFLKTGRVPAKSTALVSNPAEDPLKAIARYSRDATLVFIGLRAPEKDESLEGYAEYYGDLLKQTGAIPQTAFVLASEDIEFHNILI